MIPSNKIDPSTTGPSEYEWKAPQIRKQTWALAIFRDVIPKRPEVDKCRHVLFGHLDAHHPYHPGLGQHEPKPEDFIPAKINGTVGDFRTLIDNARQKAIEGLPEEQRSDIDEIDRRARPEMIKEINKKSDDELISLNSPDHRFAVDYTRLHGKNFGWTRGIRYQLPTAVLGIIPLYTQISSCVRTTVGFLRGAAILPDASKFLQPGFKANEVTLENFIRTGCRDA